MFFTNTLGPTVITGTDDRDTVLDFFPDATGRFIDGIGSYPNFGAGDDDTISLGDGEDRTILSPGNDRIDGGPGWDTIAAKFSPSFETPSEFEPLTSLTIEGFVVDLALGTYRAVYTGTYAELVDTGGFSPERVERDAESIWTGTLTGIEAIDGSVGPDTLLGSDETPTTSSGSETAERFNPSLGANVVDGRGGEDELYVDIFPGAFESVERDAVEIDTAAGVLIGFDLETTTFRNIERYSLSAGSDTLRGSPADERVFDIIGPGGQASLVGGAGEDLLILSSFVGLGLFADEREGVIAAIVPPGSDAAAGRNVYRG